MKKFSELRESLVEAKELTYTVVHAKKGKVVVTAPTSYDAAQKAAKQWKLKSTGGVDAYLMKESVELDGEQKGEAKRDDANFTFVSAWEWTGDPTASVLHKEELKFENIELKQRSYK